MKQYIVRLEQKVIELTRVVVHSETVEGAIAAAILLAKGGDVEWEPVLIEGPLLRSVTEPLDSTRDIR